MPWVLTNTRTVDEDERARLREYFDGLARGGADEEALKKLRRYVDDLVRMLGADFVEPRVRMLIEAAEDDQRAGLRVGLGTALCESADDDVDQRERGLAVLAEVTERWPDTEEANGRGGGDGRVILLVTPSAAPV